MRYRFREFFRAKKEKKEKKLLIVKRVLFDCKIFLEKIKYRINVRTTFLQPTMAEDIDYSANRPRYSEYHR